MCIKSRTVFFLSLIILCLALPCRTVLADGELVSPDVYSRFQALGAELSRDTQGLDGLLSHIKHKKGMALLTKAELAEFRSLRKSITGRQREVLDRLHDMEQSLIAHNADPLFLERHRKMAEDMKERFADLSDKLNREDMDVLAEKGIRSIMKGQRKPETKKDIPAKKLRAQKATPQTLPNRPTVRKQNIDEIWGAQKEEIKEAPPKMFPRTDGKLGLLQKNDAYQLVKFELPEEIFQSEIGNPKSKIQISPVTAWDLNLPQSVRPVMVASVGDVAGLLSQATMQATAPPSDNTTLIEDGIDIVFSDEIKALADSLGKDPIKMYDYVKNNIAYQPYWGSLKGARQTLLEKRGNDCDQASLLIALMRYSGYPARYGEALVTVDIARAKSWLGVQEDNLVGYLLASAHIPEVKDLYQGSRIVQVQFRHIYVEVYLPYENYRGQIRPNGGQKLWVPLSPAFKKQNQTLGVSVPFDTGGFMQGLQDHATYNPDGSLATIDKDYIREQTDAYSAQIQAFIDSQNPDMTMNQFYGYSSIAQESYPILPITLPFPQGPATQYSVLDALLHHRIVVELSYWGVDLDEELDTLEINYTAPTALIAGKPLTLSYRPATAQDIALLGKYDGNLFGTPLCLIHMYPQLKLGGVIVDENTNAGYGGQTIGGTALDNAAISMGLEETVRVKMLQPGETGIGYITRQNDYKITVGDHIAIVPGLGCMPKEQLQESMQRLSQAAADGVQDIDRLLGEQLHLTGSSYYYQLDTWYGLIAKQAGVQWFRNPSDMIVSRHLTVDVFMDMIPMSVKESTIIIDAPGNRFQAVPREGDWKNRVAFLKTAGMYGSIMEHTVLQELFQQNAVSGVKMLNAAVDNGTAIYEIGPQMTSEQRQAVLIILNQKLSSETMKIIDQELNLGQTVLVPAKEITVGTYKGAAVISSTPPNDPMGAYREGYLIARAADGGQITDLIKSLLNGFVNPNQADWLEFTSNAEKSVNTIVTNSDSIRQGYLKVRELLNGVTGIAMAVLVPQAQAATLNMGLASVGACELGMDSMNSFMSYPVLIYIDFEGNPFYLPDTGTQKTIQYDVMDLMGQPKRGVTPSVVFTCNKEICDLDPQITPTDWNGKGTLTFFAPQATWGDIIKIRLALEEPYHAETTGTVYVGKIELKADGKVVEPGLDDNYYVYIDETPKMPALSLQFKPNGMDGAISWGLTIDYDRDNRRDHDIFPTGDDPLTIQEKILPTNVSWIINGDWGDKIRGGKATIVWQYIGNGIKRDFIFYIRGKNPKENDVKPFLGVQSIDIIGLEPWFLTRLLRQESGYKQFHNDGSFGPNKEDYKFCPLLGPPAGWGIMQVEDKYAKKSAQMLWDWMSNVNEGLAELKVYQTEARNFWKKQKQDYFKWKSKNDDASEPFSVTYYDITFSYNPTGDEKSFEDAIWIKRYNGASRGHFISWQVVNLIKQYWQLNDCGERLENGVVKETYYVHDVCSQRP